jgi:hypothetical protein
LSTTNAAAVRQAEGRVAQFKAQLHIAINGSPIPGNDPLGLVGRERLLREKLGLAATDGWFIRPCDMPTEARIQFDWETVLCESLARNTELRIAKWSIKQRELEHMSAKNQSLPQLDIVGTYRWLGVGDTLISADRTGLAFPNPGSNAVENLTNGDFQEVGLRAEYTPAPIGSRREKANINATLMGLKKSHEEVREKERSMTLLLSNAWTNLHSSYISAADFLDQMQSHVAEIKNYEIQISESPEIDTLNQLLDQTLRAEELRARAEQQFYQSVVEYNKSIVNIHLVKGSIFDLNNVSLGEGAWVEKAYWDAEQRAQERAGGIYFDYGYTRPGVVSRGPVEVGGATEGNISDMTPRQTAPVVQPEEVEAKEADAAGEKKDSILDKQDSDTKSTGRLRNGSQRPAIARPNSTQAVSVRPASSEAPVVQADQFQWGELGLNNNKPALRAAGANDLKQVPQVKNVVQGNQPAPIVTGLPVNDLRPRTTNAPTNQLQKQPAATQSSTGQAPAASIQWRVRN